MMIMIRQLCNFPDASFVVPEAGIEDPHGQHTQTPHEDQLLLWKKSPCNAQLQSSELLPYPSAFQNSDDLRPTPKITTHLFFCNMRSSELAESVY